MVPWCHGTLHGTYHGAMVHAFHMTLCNIQWCHGTIIVFYKLPKWYSFSMPPTNAFVDPTELKKQSSSSSWSWNILLFGLHWCRRRWQLAPSCHGSILYHATAPLPVKAMVSSDHGAILPCCHSTKIPCCHYTMVACTSVPWLHYMVVPQ